VELPFEGGLRRKIASIHGHLCIPTPYSQHIMREKYEGGSLSEGV